MNVEQNLIKGRDMFRDTFEVLENKIVSALVNLYAEVIRSTSDEIVLTELEREPRYIDGSTIAQYIIAVEFIGKDGGKYSKRRASQLGIVTATQGLYLRRRCRSDTL